MKKHLLNRINIALGAMIVGLAGTMLAGCETPEPIGPMYGPPTVLYGPPATRRIPAKESIENEKPTVTMPQMPESKCKK